MPRQPGIAAAPPDSLYEQDHLAWIEQQSELLRAGRLQDLDLENISEELGDLGRSQRRELEHRLEIILAHLLKKQFQPKRHTRSWDVTIGEQRRQIERL